MSVSARIEYFKKQVPAHVKIIAVSKFQPVQFINEAYHSGQLMFGENKVQELLEKYTVLPSDIQWHFIGHLQTNKVKQIVPFIYCIQSVDSAKLLFEIDRHAAKYKRIVNCLLQFHIAEEEAKFGFDYPELAILLDSKEFRCLKNINLVGVMGMATFTNNQEQIRQEFKKLVAYYNSLKTVYFSDKTDFTEISMGMSDDWNIAVKEGATMIRLGTALFGTRQKILTDSEI